MNRSDPQWQIVQALLAGQKPAPAMPQPALMQAAAGQDTVMGQAAGDTLTQPGSYVPEGMTPMEWRQSQWDEQVADAYDKDAATNAIEWAVQGKRDDVAKSLDQLREAQARLESGADNLSGPLVGSWVGQQLAPMVNPESIVTREAIEEVVQRNLRLVLGAQFTEKEGERLISRAFNPKLQEPENAKRVGRLLRSIEDAAAAREAATQYFMQNGTLVGWNGRIPSIQDIEASLDADGTQPDADGWTTINGVRVRVKQ